MTKYCTNLFAKLYLLCKCEFYNLSEVDSLSIFFSTLKILEVKFSHFLFFKGYSIYVNAVSKALRRDLLLKFHNLPMFRYPKGTTQTRLLGKKKKHRPNICSSTWYLWVPVLALFEKDC